MFGLINVGLIVVGISFVLIFCVQLKMEEIWMWPLSYILYKDKKPKTYWSIVLLELIVGILWIYAGILIV